jgi:hypothetical protein
MRERRRETRHDSLSPVFVDSSDSHYRAAACHNLSKRGVLLHSSVKLTVGERLRLSIASPTSNIRGIIAEGTVVRVERDVNEPTLFPHVAGVLLDEQIPERDLPRF